MSDSFSLVTLDSIWRCATFFIFSLVLLLLSVSKLVSHKCTCDAAADTNEETHNNAQVIAQDFFLSARIKLGVLRPHCILEMYCV